MCKFNPKNESRRIDPCMRKVIFNLQANGIETLNCCCGHGVYPMTIVIERLVLFPLEIFSNKTLPRKKRFYKRDKEGVYYIPETLK